MALPRFSFVRPGSTNAMKAGGGIDKMHAALVQPLSRALRI